MSRTQIVGQNWLIALAIAAYGAAGWAIITSWASGSAADAKAVAAAKAAAVTQAAKAAITSHFVNYDWPWCMGLTLVFIMVLGWLGQKRIDGVLIDNRNRISLSKLQALCWTVLIMSGIAVIVGRNVVDGTFTGFLMTPDDTLWALMGISVASYVATPAILSVKAAQEPTDTNVTAAEAAGGAQGMNNRGLVFARNSPDDASWKDIFMGEEVGNINNVDLSKVQQVVITIILLMSYGAMVWQVFLTDAMPADMPKLPQNLLWLMGISHAGYLTYKFVPHSATDGSVGNAKKAGDGPDQPGQAVG